ncbi:MAG: prolyl oligopeptidase family serine peptidase [Pseudomonadota bacterium]
MPRHLLHILLLLSASFMSDSALIAAETPGLSYPPAPRGDLVEDYHGTQVADPYRWLEDLDSVATRNWLAAQASLSDSYLAARSSRAALRERLAQLYDHEVFGTPFSAGGRTFYTHRRGLQNQPVLLMERTAGAPPSVALDANTLSADGSLAVVDHVVSPNGRLLAYGVSVSGSDWTDWRLRDLDTGLDLPDVLRHSKYYRPVFTRDSRGLYYGAFPAPAPGQELSAQDIDHAIWYHALGTPPQADVRLLQLAGHPDWQYEPALSEDGRWLVVAVGEGQVGDKNREELYALDLSTPGSAPIALASGFDAAYLVIGSHAGLLYLLSSLDAPNGRVIAVDLARPAREHWRTVVAESQDAIAFKAGQVALVHGRLVVNSLHHAASRLTVHSLDGRHHTPIALPGAGTVSELRAHATDTTLYYSHSSVIAPPTVYRYGFESGHSSLWREPSVAFDRNAYEQKQVFYKGRDGTRIPMLLAYRKGLKLDGRNPLLLYGYGGFAIPQLPAFVPARVAWLEMGGIYAIANIRGGGEYGEAWHRAGTLEHKQVVFDDFAAAAEWLIAEHYTSTPRLAIYGRSNGGLLIGASVTQRPELFGAAVAGVGVLDMLRFDRFGQGAGWSGDYGSPANPAQFAALYAYSPVHRVRPGTHYPATLIITGDHDTRVMPMHSFKFAAALQAAQAGPAPILLDLERSSGHGGGTTTSQAIEQNADIYAFLADALQLPTR